jgi:hypothetical protein
MAIQRRAPAREAYSKGLGAGVHMARVVSVMDPTFNGRLRVTLLKDQGNDMGDDNQTYILNYASPFFGYTPFEAMGKNNNDFNDTQKSYGMWFVPPDVGVTVLCAFVDGDPSEGYWFACLPPSFANHMVPAIAGTEQVDLTAADADKYDTDRALPTGEINKRKNADEPEKNPEKIKKPVHPIADRFLEQGTLEDDVRGTVTSTGRRQTPNSVFGISTPGPLDWRDGSKRMNTGPSQNQSLTGVAVSRLGGTQFVIDDGDDRYVRNTDAGTGPVKYIDVINGEDAVTGEKTNSKGRPDIPYNEYTRIRTRTGHQLLLHNSEDLIYIGNSKGTAWVELTSNGKIDIYAADSISIHTENDLNIKADRDVNIEAGRNINMKATAEYVSPDTLHRRDDDGNPIPKIQDGATFEAGRIQIESAFNTNILIGANGRIETRNYENAEGVPTDGDLDISIIGSTRFSTGYGVVAPHDYEVKVFGDTLIKTTGNLDLNTDGNNAYTAGGTTDILSGGNHTETASQIHMNGPQARQAEEAVIANTITDLHLHTNLFTNPDKGWPKLRYLDGKIKSIMKRVPMHEPWALHENNSPALQGTSFTDRELEEGDEE